MTSHQAHTFHHIPVPSHMYYHFQVPWTPTYPYIPIWTHTYQNVPSCSHFNLHDKPPQPMKIQHKPIRSTTYQCQVPWTCIPKPPEPLQNHMYPYGPTRTHNSAHAANPELHDKPPQPMKIQHKPIRFTTYQCQATCTTIPKSHEPPHTHKYPYGPTRTKTYPHVTTSTFMTSHLGQWKYSTSAHVPPYINAKPHVLLFPSPMDPHIPINTHMYPKVPTHTLTYYFSL
jgi:hypothetical protein